MKNFIISLLTVLLVFATSCNEMDQYPHNAVSSDNLTEEDAQLLLTGLYFYIQNKQSMVILHKTLSAEILSAAERQD